MDPTTVALAVAAFTLFSGIITAVVNLIVGRGKTNIEAVGTLTDDQREFIKEVRSSNVELRDENSKLRARCDEIEEEYRQFRQETESLQKLVRLETEENQLKQDILARKLQQRINLMETTLRENSLPVPPNGE